MARKPLPAVQTGPSSATPTDATQSYIAFVQSQYLAMVTAAKNRSLIGTFNPRPPQLAVPGPQHQYAVGETPGSLAYNPAFQGIPTYDVSMIARYTQLSPAQQLAVRWAVAFKPSWTYAELEAYRRASYQAYPQSQIFYRDPTGAALGPGHVYQVGERPGAFDINPLLTPEKYDVSLIERYFTLSPSQQLAVRYAVAFKESWTYEELQAYRRAALKSSIEAQHLYQSGGVDYEAPDLSLSQTKQVTTKQGPAGAAKAFVGLSESMRTLAGQARRAGDEILKIRANLPDLWGAVSDSNASFTTVKTVAESTQI